MTFYIVGAGGFGRETLDAFRAASPGAVEPAVFLDDHPQASEIDGIPVRRPEEAEPGVFVVAVADPVARRRHFPRLTAGRVAPASVPVIFLQYQHRLSCHACRRKECKSHG